MNYILAISILLNIGLFALLLNRKTRASGKVKEHPAKNMGGVKNEWINLWDLFPELRIGYGINFVPGPAELYVQKLQPLGFAVFHIHGNDISNKQEFFEESARVFEFPAYFGMNWDAWNDCMRDFEDYAPDRSVIIWDGADHTYNTDSYLLLQAINDLYNSAMAVSLGSCRANKQQKQMVLLVIK